MFLYGVLFALVVVLKNTKILADLESYSDVSVIKLRMKNAVAQKHDDYVCSAHKLELEDDAYIVRFEPVPNTEVAHHMNINGCEEPGSDEPYWQCRPMCKGKPYFIYIWAENGTALTLPKDVGYHIGGTTKIKYIVIGMHYKDKFKEGQTDDSGYNLYITRQRPRYQIGYYTLGSDGTIPPMVKAYYHDAGCQYNRDEVLHLLMYRTHSHNLGYLTSGYRIRNGTWTEIGRMSPQLPQSFYNVTTTGMDVRRGDYLVSIRVMDIRGDYLAARCTFRSKRKYKTYIGWTNKDEMCNLYIMYYTKTDDEGRRELTCFRDHDKYRLKDNFEHLPETISSTKGLPPFEMHPDPYINDKR